MERAHAQGIADLALLGGEEVLEAAAEVYAAARIRVGIGSVIEQLAHEIQRRLEFRVPPHDPSVPYDWSRKDG